MPASSTGTCPYTVRSGDSLWLLAQRFHMTIQEIALANPGLDLNKLYIGQRICIPRRCGSMSAQPVPKGISQAEQTLSNNLRLLWEQHVYWTRMVILSMAFELPDLEYAVNRLLRNPKDFEAVLESLYGKDIAAKFAELLTEHLMIASDIIKATKAGDNAAADDAEQRWYANADQIAAFLGSVNPYWPTQEWRQMLYGHLAMTKAEAVDILTNQYEDGIEMFDNVESEALSMADLITQGIAKQFSQPFSKNGSQNT